MPLYKVVIQDYPNPKDIFFEFIMIMEAAHYSSSQLNCMYQWAFVAADKKIYLPAASAEAADQVAAGFRALGAVCTILPISQEEYDWLWKATGGEVPKV